MCVCLCSMTKAILGDVLHAQTHPNHTKIYRALVVSHLITMISPVYLQYLTTLHYSPNVILFPR